MADTVAVLYAGSLTRLMDETIGPAFEAATGIAYTGEDGLGGAVALAEAIRDGRRTPDVFLPADGTQVMRLLMPPAGDWASWYVPFGQSARVLAYSPRSRFRADFERVAHGDMAWYEVLLQPGFKFGRSDPDLDPGGYLTLLTAQLAELAYGQPGLKERLVGPDRNPDQMPPLDVLRRGLQTGELDASLAYRNAVYATNRPYIDLPPEVSLSDPDYAESYARASFTTARGHTFRGGLVFYTATVLRAAPNPDAGAAFVAYLLSPECQTLLAGAGLLPTPAAIVGARADVPDAVTSVSLA